MGWEHLHDGREAVLPPRAPPRHLAPHTTPPRTPPPPPGPPPPTLVFVPGVEQACEDADWERDLRKGRRPRSCHPSSLLKSCKGEKDVARDVRNAKPVRCTCAAKGVFGLNCGKGRVTCAKRGAKAKMKKCPKGERVEGGKLEICGGIVLVH